MKHIKKSLKFIKEIPIKSKENIISLITILLVIITFIIILEKQILIKESGFVETIIMLLWSIIISIVLYVFIYKLKKLIDSIKKLWMPYIVEILFFSSVILIFLVLFTINYCNKLSFTDLISKTGFTVVISFLILFIFDWNKKYICKKDDKEKEENFYSDKPIKSNEEDKLNRENFVSNFIKIIDNLKSTKNCYIIGLYGGWGDGKTSFLNCVKQKLLTDKDFLIVDFDPWYYKGFDAILNSFYKSIYKEISKKYFCFPVKFLIRKYIKEIKIGTFGFSFSLLNNDSHQTTKEKLNETFTPISESEKIIIIIDDLDRLQQEEIFDFLKLVKLNSDFDNFIFILAFDYKRVKNAIEKLDSNKDYIDKIVQIPIHLPEIEYDILEEYLNSEITRLFKEKYLEIDNDTSFRFKDFKELISCIVSILRNMRGVKRYLNAIKSTLPTVLVYNEGNDKKVGTEVNLYDFFAVEFIRVFYPELYRAIFERGLEGIKDLIQNLNQFEKKDIKATKLKTILESVFGMKRHISDEKSILDYKYFERYFIYGTKKGDISEGTIKYIEDLIISNDADKLKNIFDRYIKEERFQSLFEKIKSFLMEQSDDVKLNFCNLLLNFTGREYEKSRDEVALFFYYTVEKLNEYNRKKMMDEVCNMDDIFLLFKFLVNEFYNFYIFDDKQKFEEYKNKFFEKFNYLEFKNIFTNDPLLAITILRKCLTDFSTKDVRLNENFKDYLINIFDEDINNLIIFLKAKDIDSVASKKMSNTRRNMLLFEFKSHLFVYDNLEKLSKKVEEIKKSPNNIYNDNKEIIDLFEEILKECIIEQEIINISYKKHIQNAYKPSNFKDIHDASKVLKQYDYIEANKIYDSIRSKLDDIMHINLLPKLTEWDRVKNYISEIINIIKEDIEHFDNMPPDNIWEKIKEATGNNSFINKQNEAEVEFLVKKILGGQISIVSKIKNLGREISIADLF